jgi:hypothetical protein
MSGLDDAAFLVLHDIRLRGLVTRDDAAVVILVEHGFVARGTRGIRVTSEGRAVHTSWARLASGSDAEGAARRAYERFVPLNRELIRICNDWQVRPGGVPNDHTDLRYDWSVVDRLRTLDERAGPIVSRLGRAVARFDAYRPRLRSALEQVDDGQPEWLTSPRCDSYHTVWMQLHEDLLLAIGAERADEPEVSG